MVLRGVLFVFILWIGTGATQPNNGFPEDVQQPQLRRQFQADNEQFIPQSRQNFPKIQPNRRSGESRQDVADPTSRMDLVKSIDDIIRSPYGGPSLDSLSPLLQRHSSFRRPTRHSASGFQRDPVPKRRQIPTNDNVPDKIPTNDNDQFLQSNNFQPEFKRQRISQNPSGSVSFSIFESHADNNQKTSVSNWFDHSPEHRSEKKPSYSTDDSFGQDTESRFEKIRQNYNDPFETTSFQRRPNLDGSEDSRIRPNLDRPKNPRRRPINREAYSDTPRRPHDSNRPQRHSNPRPSSRYESYERPRSFPVAEGSSRLEAPFRPSPPAFSRRHTRNRRDLPVDLETQHSGAQRRSSGPTDGRPSGFPAFASIGGTAFLDEGAKVAEGSFSHNFVIPKIKIPDIGDEHPQFGPQSFGTIKTTKARTDRLSKNADEAQPIQAPQPSNPDHTKDSLKLNSSTIQERSVKKELTSRANTQDLDVEASAQNPFHRIFGRKDANPESYITHSRVPRQYIHYPAFDRRDQGQIFGRGDRAESINSPFARENIFAPLRPFHSQEDERIINQRFFPSFPDGRIFGQIPVQVPQAAAHVGRNGGRRGNNNQFQSNNRPFRGSPEAFASHNSFNDFEPVDNSILGSGNFEVIKGGTFYDEDDPHQNHNPYDPYLDNSYVVFPSGNPPSSNHVDDFFQNFRDFSEFATRRSGSDHFDESPNDGYLASGFSEHIPLISRTKDMMTSESKSGPPEKLTEKYEIIETKVVNKMKTDKLKLSKNDSNQTLTEKPDKLSFLKPKQIKKYNYQKKINKENIKNKKISPERRRPKNIQEVLAQMDINPKASESINDSIDATDPLIAIF